MANNSNQSNLNVGLNLNGNAVSSVAQLVKHMEALKKAAVDVGNALDSVDAKTEVMSAQTLKKLNQQMKLLTTSPQMLEQQYYQSINKTAQAGRLNSLINTTKQLHNPNTLNKLIEEHGASTVEKAIETRLNAANLKKDTKAIQRAQLEMQTFKAEMAKYNVSLKGLQQIKAEQDALVSQMLSTPVGAAALRGGMQSKLGRNYTTAAQEKLIRQYMANPSQLAPENASGLATAAPDVLKQQQQMNASKIQATQRLMGQSLLEGTPQSKAQYDLHVKTLAALEDEKTKLQAIGNLRRANLRTQDQELKKIRETTEATKANEKLNSLLNGNLKTRTLSAEQLMQLPQDNLLNREITMKTRLKQANEAMRLSESLGNKKAQKESAQLAIAYQKELDMISRRKKQFDQIDKPNGMVSRFQDMSSGESSGALLGIQGILMRNYMLWGAFVGSIAGSYAFLRDFELALKQTQAISQATNTQVEQLRDNILSVAENSRFTAIEITEAATALAQAGFSMSEIETTLESVTLLATATGSTLKETVDIATASLGAFQLSASNMPSIVNQITQAMNLSKLDIQKFQLAVQYAGNAASDAGLNFEELLASVSTVANAGVRSGSTLGTGFRQLLSDLIAPSAKFEKILTRLGLTTADVDVRTNGLVGTLKQLKEAGFTTADAYESFEVRSVAFYTALANNLDTYDDLLANLDSNTAAMDANEIQMNSLGAQTDRMFNQFKAVAEVVGGPLRDALTALFRLTADIFVGIKELTDNGLVRFVVQVAAGGAALGGTVVVMKGVIGTLAGLGGALKAVSLGMTATATTTVAAGTAVTVMGRTIALTNPVIFALAAALTAAILVATKFTKANEDLKNSVEDSKTVVNQLKDSTANLQTVMAETDKKIVSLESRFESLRDDPAAVAVEMTNLQNKAMELGVTLETDLNNGIQSVIDGWRELRLELGKELEMNLDRQFEELNILAGRMALLRAEEMKNKPRLDSVKGAEENGFDFIANYGNLKEQAGDPLNMAKSAMSGGDPSTRAAARTTLATIFNEVAKASEVTLTSTELMDRVTTVEEAVRNIDSYTTEQIVANQPKWNQMIGEVLGSLRVATDDYRKSSNTTKFSAESRANAKKSAATLVSVSEAIQNLQTTLNSVAQPGREARTVGGQASVQGYVNQYGQSAEVALRSMSAAEHKKIKYNDPRLDAYTVQKGMEKDMDWAIPLLLAIRKDGEASNNNQTSPKGAKSVMQFMPKTWGDFNKGGKRDLNNPADTIDAAYDFVNWISKKYNTTDPAVIAAYYNGGDNDAISVQKTGKAVDKEAQKYVPKVMAGYRKYSSQKGFVTTGNLPLDENAEVGLMRKEYLESQKQKVSDALTALGDASKYSAEQKKLAEDYRSRLTALDQLLSQASSETMNVLRNAQLQHQQEVKKKDSQLKLQDQRATQEIENIEYEIKEFERDMALRGFTKSDVAGRDSLYKKLADAKKAQLELKNQIRLNMSYEYKEDQILTNATLEQMANEQLDFDIQKVDRESETKRKEGLKTLAKEFADKIKEQNDLFITTFKNELLSIKNEYDEAMSILDFDRKQADRNFREFNGLSSLSRERALMDDPRYRDQYTDTQRSKIDREIELLSNQATRAQTPYLEADRNAKVEQVKKLEDALNSLVLKRKEAEVEFDLKINRSGLDQTQVTTLKAELEKDLNKNEKEVNKHREEIWALQDTIANLDLEIKAARNNGLPEQMDMGSIFREKAAETYRLTQTSAAMDSNITTVLDGINGAFNNLINTAIDASDNVDDFFKILTGGAEGTREAFKAMGYSIVQTMAKIVQDTMVKKFMSMMMNWIFPEGGASVGGGGGILGTIVGSIAGAFGQGVVSGTGTLWGMPAANAPTGMTGTIGAGGGVSYMSQGGRVVGSNKNVDDVPIMGADGEYMLPSSVTETVGLGFLERLRKDPNSVVNDKIKINTEGKGKAQVPSFTNVYVVSPDKVPSSTSQSDIIVAVEDNISRNGSLKQLIKQVANG